MGGERICRNTDHSRGWGVCQGAAVTILLPVALLLWIQASNHGEGEGSSQMGQVDATFQILDEIPLLALAHAGGGADWRGRPSPWVIRHESVS
jgi:hypothetical protein